MQIASKIDGGEAMGWEGQRHHARRFALLAGQKHIKARETCLQLAFAVWLQTCQKVGRRLIVVAVLSNRAHDYHCQARVLSV